MELLKLSEDAFLSLLLEEDLYLIDLPQADEAEDAIQDVEGIHFYGENKLNTLVLVDSEEPDFLKTPEYTLLLKIMGAVKHTPNEFALVNIKENNSLSWSLLVSSFSPKNTIIFGVSIAETLIPIATGLYQISQSETSNFILADDLRQVMTDNNKKKLLWTGLKQLFAI
ncbi:MAG: hypothetical protein ACPGJS_06990 [Flammeovirgaceae bacterium]